MLNPYNMKSKLQFITFIFLSLTYSVSLGQAWEKSTKVLGLGIGASAFFQYGKWAEDGEASIPRWDYPPSGQLNFQGEFGIHNYVGIGFTTGIGGNASHSWRGKRYWGSGAAFYAGSFIFPIGMIANFHFYQLIADKTGKEIHADKLDIYGGVSLGSGVAMLFYREGVSNRLSAIIFGGVHAGARYYFTDKFGVNLEVGWGKHIVNGGVVFKLQ